MRADPTRPLIQVLPQPLTQSPPGQAVSAPGKGYAALAVALITLVSGLRLWYLTHDCPLDLSPDEAHYWDWSRHLDWSYYSKGPLVAWLIRASCAILGETMPAVRLPAVLCGALTLWGVFLLTRRVWGDARLALGAVALAVTLPVLAAGSLLMTIDAPYVCCWTWALVLAERVVGRQGGRAAAWPWLLLGLVIGVGILAKYTMVLFIPSLALFFLAQVVLDSRAVGEGWGSAVARVFTALPRGFWVMGLTAAACCLPIVIWNAQHGWVTVLHVGRQAGVQQPADAVRWLGPLEYVAGQAALLLGVWFFIWLAAMTAAARRLASTLVPKSDSFRPSPELGPWHSIENRKSKIDNLLWWLSAPMFLVFLAFSAKTKTELNWPVTAYLSGLVLAAGWLVGQWSSPRAGWRRLVRGSVAFAAGLGLCLTVVMHQSEWLYPVITPLGGPDGRLAKVRRWDPTCRLRGWSTLGAEVGRVRAQLRNGGVEPVLAASGWALPGAIGFYTDGRPEVYSLALALGGRHSQYDLWRPNPVSDPDAFRGRTFIFIGEPGPVLQQAFDRLEPTRLVTHTVAGQPVASWQVTVCRGFRGFASVRAGGY